MKITIEAGPNMEDLMDSLSEYIYTVVEEVLVMQEWSKDRESEELNKRLDRNKEIAERQRKEIINQVTGWGG